MDLLQSFGLWIELTVYDPITSFAMFAKARRLCPAALTRAHKDR